MKKEKKGRKKRDLLYEINCFKGGVIHSNVREIITNFKRLSLETVTPVNQTCEGISASFHKNRNILTGASQEEETLHTALFISCSTHKNEVH